MPGNSWAQTKKLRIEHEFVHVAPHPAFTGLDGLHDRVFGGVKMFRGVLIFGGVATTDVSALAAKTKMYPGIAHLQALFAAFSVRLDVFDMI
jgi:hypothetical protein